MESNEEQIQYWNEKAGPTWVERQVDLDRLIDPLGRVAIDAAAPSPGEQVLDVAVHLPIAHEPQQMQAPSGVGDMLTGCEQRVVLEELA